MTITIRTKRVKCQCAHDLRIVSDLRGVYINDPEYWLGFTKRPLRPSKRPVDSGIKGPLGPYKVLLTVGITPPLPLWVWTPKIEPVTQFFFVNLTRNMGSLRHYRRRVFLKGTQYAA